MSWRVHEPALKLALGQCCNLLITGFMNPYLMIQQTFDQEGFKYEDVHMHDNKGLLL